MGDTWIVKQVLFRIINGREAEWQMHLMTCTMDTNGQRVGLYNNRKGKVIAEISKLYTKDNYVG